MQQIKRRKENWSETPAVVHEKGNGLATVRYHDGTGLYCNMLEVGKDGHKEILAGKLTHSLSTPPFRLFPSPCCWSLERG